MPIDTLSGQLFNQAYQSTVGKELEKFWDKPESIKKETEKNFQTNQTNEAYFNNIGEMLKTIFEQIPKQITANQDAIQTFINKNLEQLPTDIDSQLTEIKQNKSKWEDGHPSARYTVKIHRAALGFSVVASLIACVWRDRRRHLLTYSIALLGASLACYTYYDKYCYTLTLLDRRFNCLTAMKNERWQDALKLIKYSTCLLKEDDYLQAFEGVCLYKSGPSTYLQAINEKKNKEFYDKYKERLTNILNQFSPNLD